MDQSATFQQVAQIIAELFEIDAARITPEARLYEDLELDSIDAVDMAAELRSLTGKKLAPEDFKQVRTVQDVVDAIIKLQQAAQ